MKNSATGTVRSPAGTRTQPDARSPVDARAQTEARLLEGSSSVISLFAKDPFDGAPPNRVRAVAWQYWFTDAQTHRATGAWWRREEIGLYCPSLVRGPDGSIEMPRALVPYTGFERIG